MAAGVLVLVTSSYPGIADGTEAAGSFVADLVEALSRHVRVRVVAPGIRNTIQVVHTNLQVYRFSAPARPLSTLRLYVLADVVQVIKVLHAGGKATLAAVAAGEVVHIFGLWALPCGYWARRAARLFNVPYSVWTLGSDIWSLGRIPVIRGILAGVLRDAARCYSDGYLLRDDTRRIAGREVYFLTSTRKIAPTGEKVLSTLPPYRLVFIGRWHPNKGPDLLVEALELLDDDCWQRIAAVEIHGGGQLQTVLEVALRRLVVKKRPVTLGGYIDKDEAQAVLQRADFVLIPSRIESIPVIFSDAMKLRCPVIANPVGDLPSLVTDGPVGVIAASTSAKSYADAIRVAVNSSPAEYGMALDAMAMRFSLEEFLVPKLISELALDRS